MLLQSHSRKVSTHSSVRWFLVQSHQAACAVPLFVNTTRSEVATTCVYRRSVAYSGCFHLPSRAPISLIQATTATRPVNVDFHSSTSPCDRGLDCAEDKLMAVRPPRHRPAAHGITAFGTPAVSALVIACGWLRAVFSAKPRKVVLRHLYRGYSTVATSDAVSRRLELLSGEKGGR